MSSPNYMFSAYFFLCDYVQEILLTLETIIINDSVGGIIELGCVSCLQLTFQYLVSHTVVFVWQNSCKGDLSASEHQTNHFQSHDLI